MGAEVLIWVDLFLRLFVEGLATVAAIAVVIGVAGGLVRLAEGRGMVARQAARVDGSLLPDDVQ